MRWAVVTFPGSNCDRDCVDALERVLEQDVVSVWHKETSLPRVDCVVLPGGFSYGDYLRAGAIARFSPIMREVAAFAESGGLVLGICNGFQILLEAGLLPGAMHRNEGLHFVCSDVHLRVERRDTPLTRAVPRDVDALRIPVAHMEGNYTAPPDLMRRIEGDGQVLLRYCTEDGTLDPAANPNGSMGAVAGLANAEMNVFGMMPHPERACEAVLGGTDGAWLLRSLAETAWEGRG